MTVQYLRTLTAKVGDKTFRYDGVRDDGLRIRFATQQADVSTPNTLELLLTNLNEDSSRPAIYENKDVELSAGYGDGGEMLLFKGQTRQARDLRESVTDRVLAILATDHGKARNYAVAMGHLSAGHEFKDQAEIAFKGLREFGVKIGYVCPLLPGKKFPRGFTFAGSAKHLLAKVCEATDTSWSIQNGTLQIVPNKEGRPGDVIVLNGNTGLLGWPVQSINGIEATTLLNGRIVPTSMVQIDQKSIQAAAIDPSYAAGARNEIIPKIATDGLYKVFLVSHRGDTRGNEWMTDFVAVRKGDTIPVTMAARGLSLD